MLRERFDDLQSVGRSIMAGTIKRPVVEKRNDPRPRPISPGEGMTRIVDADPNMKYIWASLHGSADNLGVHYYEACGYTKCMREEGGPRPIAMHGVERGAPIVQNDFVLMQIPREQYREEIYQPGQDDMTVLERKIYNKEFARREAMKVSGIAGMIGNEEIQFENETSPLMRGV